MVLHCRESYSRQVLTYAPPEHSFPAMYHKSNKIKESRDLAAMMGMIHVISSGTDRWYW